MGFFRTKLPASPLVHASVACLGSMLYNNSRVALAFGILLITRASSREPRLENTAPAQHAEVLAEAE
jgi:hypothetical protein